MSDDQTPARWGGFDNVELRLIRGFARLAEVDIAEIQGQLGIDLCQLDAITAFAGRLDREIARELEARDADRGRLAAA